MRSALVQDRRVVGIVDVPDEDTLFGKAWRISNDGVYDEVIPHKTARVGWKLDADGKTLRPRRRKNVQ